MSSSYSMCFKQSHLRQDRAAAVESFLSLVNDWNVQLHQKVLFPAAKW